MWRPMVSAMVDVVVMTAFTGMSVCVIWVLAA